MKLERILVATDFSDFARTAVDQAAAAARGADAELVVVYAFDATPTSSYAVADQGATSAAIDEWLADERARRQKALAGLEQELVDSGVRARAVFAEGFADDVIIEQSEAVNASLVVLGSHGRTGVSRWLLGSVAEHVTRRSAVPVLIARGSAGPFRKLLVPTDFTPFARRALDAAIAIAAPDAALDVVHFWQDPLTSPIYFEAPPTPETVAVTVSEAIEASVRERGDALIAELGALDGNRTASFDCRPDTARHGIEEALGAGEYDLVVMGSHGRRGLKRFFLGSVAETILRHATCSVLIAHSEP